jgi:hypothetical protein
MIEVSMNDGNTVYKFHESDIVRVDENEKMILYHLINNMYIVHDKTQSYLDGFRFTLDVPITGIRAYEEPDRDDMYMCLFTDQYLLRVNIFRGLSVMFFEMNDEFVTMEDHVLAETLRSSPVIAYIELNDDENRLMYLYHILDQWRVFGDYLVDSSFTSLQDEPEYVVYKNGIAYRAITMIDTFYVNGLGYGQRTWNLDGLVKASENYHEPVLSEDVATLDHRYAIIPSGIILFGENSIIIPEGIIVVNTDYNIIVYGPYEDVYYQRWCTGNITTFVLDQPVRVENGRLVNYKYQVDYETNRVRDVETLNWLGTIDEVLPKTRHITKGALKER